MYKLFPLLHIYDKQFVLFGWCLAYHQVPSWVYENLNFPSRTRHKKTTLLQLPVPPAHPVLELPTAVSQKLLNRSYSNFFRDKIILCSLDGVNFVSISKLEVILFPFRFALLSARLVPIGAYSCERVNNDDNKHNSDDNNIADINNNSDDSSNNNNYNNSKATTPMTETTTTAATVMTTTATMIAATMEIATTPTTSAITGDNDFDPSSRSNGKAVMVHLQI